MRFRVFKNMIKQGFEGAWRNRGMGVASVGSISAVLMILGIVIILMLSINNVVVDVKTKFDEVQIYLEDDIRPDQLKNIEDYMKETKSISNYEFISKDRALDSMKKDWEEESYLLEGLEENNPLQNSYIITLDDIENSDSVVKDIEVMEGVESIEYYKDVIDKLINIARYIQLGGIVIIGALVLVSIFIISNTVKLTVASRKREINIMKYVGATNGYIRGPFIIEGIVFGLIGAVISILIIKFGYQFFFNSINDELYLILTALIPPAYLIKELGIIFMAIGVGIGSLGSIVSLKRYLNV